MNIITETDRITTHDWKPTWYQPIQVVEARDEMEYRWQLLYDVADEELAKDEPDRERIGETQAAAIQAQEFYFDVYHAWEVKLSRHWSDNPKHWAGEP